MCGEIVAPLVAVARGAVTAPDGAGAALRSPPSVDAPLADAEGPRSTFTRPLSPSNLLAGGFFVVGAARFNGVKSYIITNPGRAQNTSSSLCLGNITIFK
jgi:hypothetical protein